MGSQVPTFQIVAFRSVTSLVVCAAYARARGIAPLFGRRSNLRFLASRGIFGAAAMTTYYFCIKLLPLADAVTLFFLNPAITAVAAWAIMREPLGLRGVAGVAASLAGLVLL
ncbi:Solute carrier family 35 member G1, partial [Tetrabaena socialis]